MLTLLIILTILILLVTSALLFMSMHRQTTQQDNVSKLTLQLEHIQKQYLDFYKLLQDGLRDGMQDVRQQVQQTLQQHTTSLNQQFDKLSQTTEHRLKDISGQVEKRLTDGFEKTHATFTNIVKRLAIIDAAQQKITELSSNVVSLQNILMDKRTRGAFGEVQLTSLIRNVMPESSFALQYTLPNGKRADCLLFLPEPTGNIAIDAKFPLETYQLMTEPDLAPSEQTPLRNRFRQDIQKHIQDIAERYILPGTTADGAMMFIPAEAIFAEIHAHFPELVDLSHRSKVWIVSPTTMMAILTTARAVLKDAATREQVHIIQQHLHMLSKDFNRFQKRMDNLAKHIELAHTDVAAVHTSAHKITQRFEKIERVELDGKTNENFLNHVIAEDNADVEA